MAKPTNLDFLTQIEPKASSEQDAMSPIIISETPTKALDQQHITSSWSVQEVTSTAAPPSHHSEKQIERADQAASEHSPELDDDPMDVLFTTVCKSLIGGYRLAVVQQVVDEAAACCRPDLDQNVRHPTHPEDSTLGHFIMTIGQEPDLGEHDTALGTDSVGESQPGRKPSSQDQAGKAARPAKANGGDLVQQTIDEESDTDLTLIKLSDLNKLCVNAESTFRRAVQAYHLEVIEVGTSSINLLDLAKAAVDINRKLHKRAMTDEDTWQLLFNIIINMLVFGFDPLYKTVRAIRIPPENDVNPPSDADEMSGVSEAERALQILTRSMCSWTALDKRSSLITVYSYSDRLQAIDLYDEMTKPEKKKSTKALLKRKRIPIGRGRNALSNAILHYICKQSYGKKVPTEKKIRTDVAELSNKIRQFRPVCALVEAFGQGVLVLLGANPQKFLKKLKREPSSKKTRTNSKQGQLRDVALAKLKEKPSSKIRTHFKHERLRAVAVCLKQADRNNHDGQLRALFDELYKKVLSPALYLREHGKTEGWSFDDPEERAFKRMPISERISFVLGHIKCEDARADEVPAQAGECPRKRKISSGGREKTSAGAKRTSKKIKLT